MNRETKSSGFEGLNSGAGANVDVDELNNLQVLKARYELILGAAGEGIYGLDCGGLTTFVNAAAGEILGWKSTELLGEPLHNIHHHSYADGRPYPREECPIYAALKDGEVHHGCDEVFWHRDGHSVPVEYTSTPIWDEGKLKGAVVVFRDITDRVEAEQEKQKAFEQISCLKEQLELERDYLRDEINAGSSFGDIIGNSKALQRTMAQINAVSSTPASVLVLGQSGVGKEMIARAIHTNSDRADRPLVKVNCASIPAELFESEFFGHVKGSFTGAHRDRVGRMELANTGTLFLDEVGEIPLSLQGKLLRALQENEFERVGDEKTIRVDVRIVAATNKDLLKEIKAGNFREDLYYRLSVFPIEIPSLRERTEDIVPIAQNFINKYCDQIGRKPLVLSQANAIQLQRHTWPGNIRELKNVIERAVILSQSGKLRLDLALPNSSVLESGNDQSSSQQPHEKSLQESASDYLNENEFIAFEKQNLEKAMRAAGGKVSGAGGAAELMGVKSSTLSYRVAKLGIKL